MNNVFDQLTLDGSTRQQKLYEYSIEVLQMAEPAEGYYLCTSFGKDSIAAHRLCDEAGVKYDAHHNVTGIDPPELVYFGRKHYPDVKREPYKLDMWRLIQKKGMRPMRNIRFCCESLKEQGGIGRRKVLGVRASESTKRKINRAPVTAFVSNKEYAEGKRKRMFDPDDIRAEIHKSNGCVGNREYVISPMYYWTDDDLWDFIRDRNMPYCSLYDEGFKRLGCISAVQWGEPLPVCETLNAGRDFIICTYGQ
jgi:phosphoadenosine phosphosulfate reductase